MVKSYMQKSTSAIELMRRSFAGSLPWDHSGRFVRALILNQLLCETPERRQAESILNNRGRLKTSTSDQWTM
jgi:hypothetical protein